MLIGMIREPQTPSSVQTQFKVSTFLLHVAEEFDISENLTLKGPSWGVKAFAKPPLMPRYSLGILFLVSAHPLLSTIHRR